MALFPALTASEVKTNLLSGVTVALALVPEAIAFALVAHVNPLVGLYAACILCFFTAAFGGRPGMISGATGSTAVVMTGLVVQYGVEYLFLTMVLAGVIQILFAALRCGKFIRMTPHPVMMGFGSGLAILVALAQRAHFKSRDALGHEQWIRGPQLATMFALIAVAMLIIYLLPRLTRAVPSSLAAIVLVALATGLGGVHTKTVGDMASIRGGLPHFHLAAAPYTVETLRIIFPYAFIIACVGLVETLLTLNLVDEMTETVGQPNRESLAQGAANILCGFLGAMGGCALIGQTVINVSAGGRRRLSGMTAGLCLLCFILFGSSLIERIPIAALVAVMFVVSQKTFAWGVFRIFGKVPRQDVLVMIAVTVVTVVTDLATAVILGIVLSALVFAWQNAKNLAARTLIDEQGRKVYKLRGALFFASSARFLELFTPAEDPAEVIVEFGYARLMDHSALVAIGNLAEKYEALGKRLHLRQLSPECRELLRRAGGLVEVSVLEASS